MIIVWLQAGQKTSARMKVDCLTVVGYLINRNLSMRTADRSGDNGCSVPLPQLSHVCLGRSFLALVEGNAGNVVHD